MNNHVYLLFDYEEHGPQNLRATLDPGKLHSLLDTFKGHDLNSAHQRLDAVIAQGGGSLGNGWGAIELEIVELYE